MVATPLQGCGGTVLGEFHGKLAKIPAKQGKRRGKQGKHAGLPLRTPQFFLY
jgi:hypothetical protein